MTRWSDHSTNPNSPEALALRASQLDGRARAITQSRLDLMRDLAAGKKVLDVGCVDHDFRTRNPLWLHDVLRATAREIVGADYDAKGVEQMLTAGYDVLHVDVTCDVSALAQRGPFDLIVAGEVIEHVNTPQALLDLGPPLLAPGGELVLTNLNPFAPWRVRNGQRGVVWENTDHVIYGFPSRMAEMADRAGLELVWFGSIDMTGGKPAFLISVLSLIRAKRRRQPIEPWSPSPLDVLMMRARRNPMLQEQTIYCFRVR